MKMHCVLGACLCAVVLAALGCANSPTEPGRQPPRPIPIPLPPAPPPPAGPTETTFTIKDGWSGVPVAGASVTAEAQTGTTDANGTIRLTVDLPNCLTVTIRAAGFLERRTCALQDVTLWPVEGAAEQAATRATAYPNDRRAGSFWGPVEVVLLPELRSRPEIVGIWTEAVGEIRRLTNSALNIQMLDKFTDYAGWEIAVADSDTVCTYTPRAEFEVNGFCIEPTTEYFVDRINVSLPLLGRSDVALRALLRAVILKPHSLPGLLNSTRPGPELSTFERKTLHMLGLRWPKRGVWPDTDLQ